MKVRKATKDDAPRRVRSARGKWQTIINQLLKDGPVVVDVAGETLHFRSGLHIAARNCGHRITVSSIGDTEYLVELADDPR